ncbi:hypothetical protein [Streptomyces gobiensis]|uniref:hypothetical protein n=1 Tax=Streptomyces gobiensis TaxID=2875706 RepID=UPI001E329BCE|nr:hypothetical protein [Streptomyces gobiensis]UGY91343.1 hypothetical protein test1122_06160 [Streptomyces gobiensis]
MTAPSARPEPWKPPTGQDVEMRPAGRSWDAVKVPAYLGVVALEQLGEDNGAVIEDGFGAVYYWLVAPGAADDWALQRVEVCGQSTYVAVPPQRFVDGPGLRWRVPLAPGRYLTDPELLHKALAAAVADAFGPRNLTS